VGQKLLDAALVQMHATGASCCLLEVRQSNMAARTLYERSGFRLDGIRKNYYPASTGREDALLMSRKLEG
jgi:ribosomal-protein-alanine N-acetyltransferase